MSFSGNVKAEIQDHISSARHCRLAELATFVQYAGAFETTESGDTRFVLSTENDMVARKCFTLWKMLFSDEQDTSAKKVMEAIFYNGNEHTVDARLIKNSCCRRAFLRGIFLCCGSISDPQKGYHLEMVCEHEKQASQVRDIMREFELDAKIVQRKKYHVVYVKDGEGIVNFLNIIEAHKALMDLENLRILKEMRNSINRKVNCEAANITKTVEAAAKQVEDIMYLQKYYGLDKLSPSLKQMAEVRLAYPDASLKELGAYLDPPVGKSGVNHRLRKLTELAESMQG